MTHTHIDQDCAAESPAPPVMDALKHGTLEHHHQAEHHPFQRALASGALPRDAYLVNLGQMMILSHELGRCLNTLTRRDERAAAVIHERQFREPDFASDLEFFGVSPASVRPLPGVVAVVSELHGLAASAPLSPLGMHYVLEGSTNGGQYIARGVRRGYGLTGPDGTRALDPYGPRQHELWAGFKAAMNRQRFNAAETSDLLMGARWMFDAVSRVGSAVLGSSGPASSEG